MSEYTDPRDGLKHEICMGQVYTDSRTDEELVVLFQGDVVLVRDEDGGHRLIPLKQFRQAVGGNRYKLDRNEDGTYAKDGKLRKLRKMLERLQSEDGRKAAHKAEALDEAIETLSEEDNLDDMQSIDFEDVSGIGASTANCLRTNGYSTKGDVRGASDDELLDVRGIGKGNLDNLRQYIEQS
jgi:DNA-directed RNA polymerase alpha subunit